MTLQDFLNKTNLEHSLLIGYYGGGNYGDELLLEVLSNLLSEHKVRDASITYQQPKSFGTMHHYFGYDLVDIHDRKAMLMAALRKKRIIIGGGGLWGVDMNTNTFILSAFLFVCRYFLAKKIYLLGVGYYSSTTMQGRIAAWLAGKAANHIIARDPESFTNFRRITKRVSQDSDIAWYIDQLDLTNYMDEADELSKTLPIGPNTLLVALRRPQAKRQGLVFKHYNRLIGELIAKQPNTPIVLTMLESEAKDPELYQLARAWKRKHQHLRILEAPYNPLTLFAFIRKHRKNLRVIAPQLHLIMSAHLNDVPFMPIVYDNKVAMLLDRIGVPQSERLDINDVDRANLQTFAGGTA